MNTNMSMFLLLAEELNFNRAAQRAFVTQQCLSDHIRRLEQRYHTTLFNRKPKISLTESGLALLEAARRIQMIEDSFQTRLQELEGGASGTLQAGITFARSHILIPRIFPPFHEKYPGVDLQFEFGDTQDLVKLLQRGKLDCFLGVNTPSSKGICAIPLCRESICLLASDRYLKRYFGTEYSSVLEQGAQAADLSRFEHLPLVRNHPDSTLTTQLNQFLASQRLSLSSTVAVSEYSIQISLCATGHVAAFCPSSLLNEVWRQNKLLPADDQIHAFPIRGLEDALQIELLYNADRYYPAYARDFFQIIKQAVLENQH